MDTLQQDLVRKVVQMGSIIRRYRLQGKLSTLAPPTIYSYLAFLRMAQSLPHLSLQQVALATLLGNAGQEDKQHVALVFNEVFGLQEDDLDEPAYKNPIPF